MVIAFGVLPNLIHSQLFLSLEGRKAEMTILTAFSGEPDSCNQSAVT